MLPTDTVEEMGELTQVHRIGGVSILNRGVVARLLAPVAQAVQELLSVAGGDVGFDVRRNGALRQAGSRDDVGLLSLPRT